MSERYGDSDIDEALRELHAAAGIGPLDVKVNESLEEKNPEPIPLLYPFAELSGELRWLAILYFKNVVTFEEVTAPDRTTMLDKLRREGRI